MITVRHAEPNDAELVARFILDLAKYEKLESEARPSVAQLRKQLMPSAEPKLHCLISELDGVPVGFLLYFFFYSTFETNWGVYVEDLFVQEDVRGKGAGKALLKAIGCIAKAHDSKRIDLNVLHWNQGSIGVYERLGAVRLSEWTRMRFEQHAIDKLAS